MSKRYEKAEILAPVGGSEQLIAAVRCGADAVYLGTKRFNARQNAENFDSSSSLRDAVSYCHARGVRVHVTFNTLINDDELRQAEDNLREIALSGADAVIIQDLAVAEMVRRMCPSLPMHASTQMAVHNIQGVKELERLGFSRVVLARELTLGEIAAVCDSTELEVESFVHGALCMGASGLCELSAMIGGRSGNRGLCAQPCRLDFRCRGRDHALSLKDMSYISHIPELLNAGVCSLKIEGRMKRPEYVAAAVTACRQSAAGQPYDLQSLRAVFSRSGFTDGYLTGKRTLDMFGHRTKEDVTAGQSVIKSLGSLYKSELQNVALDMTLTLRTGFPAFLSVSDGKLCFSAAGPVPETARTVALDKATAGKNLARTGGTPFYLRSLTFESDRNLTLPLSSLNSMRREALDGLLKLRGEIKPLRLLENEYGTLPEHEAARSSLRLRFEHSEQIFELPEAELIILPLNEITQRPKLIDTFGAKLCAELPALCCGRGEEAVSRKLMQLKDMGLSSASAENLYALRAAREAGLEVHGGAFLNILNSRLLREYELSGLSDAIVSVEISAQRLRRLKGTVKRGVIAYGYLPLMKLRACPAQTQSGCAGCTGLTPVKDRKGETFNIICRDKAYSELLNCVPLYTGDRRIAGADFSELYFTVESREKCREIAGLFIRGEKADFRHTGGLYFREVL